MSSQTRRDRPSRTCRPCKRRKVKCDRCSKVRISCIYDDDESLPKTKNYEFVDETARTAAEASGTHKDTEQAAPNGSPIIGHLSQQPAGRLRYVEPTYWAFDKDEIDPLDTLLIAMNRYDMQDPSEENEELDKPSSSISSSASGNPGTSGPKLPYRLMGELTSPTPAWSPALLSTSRLQRQATNPLSFLPSKVICDRLFGLYLEGYHNLIPMIHAPSFKIEYASIWDHQSDGQSSVNKSMHFISLVLAVLFAGAAACPNRNLIEDVVSPDETPESLASSIRERGLRALQQANFPKTPSLETLTAYATFQLTWMKDEEPLTTCAFVGLAYRVSQMLGLHHDPSQFPSLSKVVCETRRRLWWVIVHIDVSVGVAAGLPPMIDLSTCDVHSVCEMEEELIGAVSDATGGEKLSIPGILFGGKTRDILVTRYVLSKIYGHHALSRQDITSIRAKCRALTADLAAKIHMIPKKPLIRIDTLPVSYEHANAKTARNLEAFTRLFFSAMIDKKWFLACHPILKSTIHEYWKEVYPKALEHCRDFLYKIAQLSSFEEFQLFQWCYPGMHQPLHALITLLHSLIRAPQSRLAPSFRHALDTVFALCGPNFNGGIVASSGLHPSPSQPFTNVNETRKRPLTEGGIECWTLLWRMRARAWTMAGLDPDIIPTRSQALDALYKLYEQPNWDEGLALEQALAGDFDSETPQTTNSDSVRARSASSQFETGASSSRSMSLQLGLSGLENIPPPQPPQPQDPGAQSWNAPFHATSHAQDHHSNIASGNQGMGMHDFDGTSGMGGEALGDPTMPAPNVDLMFWDQMLDEQFYGNYQQGDGMYGVEQFQGGMEEMRMDGNMNYQSGRRGSRMEGDIDFHGGGTDGMM